VHIKGLQLSTQGLSFFQHASSISPHPRMRHMRIIAGLYDGRTATMFGSQCMSKPTCLPSAEHWPNADVCLDLDVFWYSQICDPDVSMIVQLTMATMDSGGMLVDEHCLAWAKLPLTRVRSRGVDAYHRSLAGNRRHSFRPLRWGPGCVGGYSPVSWQFAYWCVSGQAL
jgi:hypothetical protein